jgi:hypothetical protein
VFSVRVTRSATTGTTAAPAYHYQQHLQHATQQQQQRAEAEPELFVVNDSGIVHDGTGTTAAQAFSPAAAAARSSYGFG